MWLPGRSPVNCSYPGNMGWACMKGTNALQETKAPSRGKTQEFTSKESDKLPVMHDCSAKTEESN